MPRKITLPPLNDLIIVEEPTPTTKVHVGKMYTKHRKLNLNKVKDVYYEATNLIAYRLYKIDKTTPNEPYHYKVYYYVEDEYDWYPPVTVDFTDVINGDY